MYTFTPGCYRSSKNKGPIITDNIQATQVCQIARTVQRYIPVQYIP